MKDRLSQFNLDTAEIQLLSARKKLKAAEAMPSMTATQTGMLFMPGSLVTAAFMLPVGFLTSKVNPKILVLLGLSLGELSVLTMAHFTLDTGPHDFLIPLMMRGAAMAFLFIPINQMVLGEFSGTELGQVAGMQNFFRQMGGSIGIASLDTLITRSSSVGLWYQSSFAVRGLYGRVAQQVFIQSFEQLCWVIAAVVACGLIPLFLIKPTKKHHAPALDAH